MLEECGQGRRKPAFGRAVARRVAGVDRVTNNSGAREGADDEQAPEISQNLNRREGAPVRRRTGAGWAPLWALLAVLCLSAWGCASDTSAREEEEMRRLALMHFDEGMRHSAEGNDLLALDYLERSVLMSPRPAAHYQIGRIRERLGETEAAMDAYRAALALAPDNQEAKFSLLALEHSPAPDRTAQMQQLRAAQVQRTRERMSEAADDRSPTLGEVRSLIFPGMEAEEEIPSATDPVYQPNEQMVLGTYAYHLENGRRFEAQGNWERAADEYRSALKADANQLDARLNLGDMMLRLERHASAYAHYSEAVKRFPGSPRPLLKMGNYYDSLERPDLARDYYSQSLFLEPGYGEALNNLAALEIRNKNYGEAVALLEMAVRSEPNYPLPWLNLGIARENHEDKPGALEAYRKYVELDGERSEEVSVWIAEMESE